MLNYILDELKKIMAIDSPSGFTRKAADYIMQQLREFGFEPELTRKGCVLCCLGGEGSPVVFSAHIDTLGGMVSEVKSNGRLKLTRIGGISPKASTKCFRIAAPVGVHSSPWMLPP